MELTDLGLVPPARGIREEREILASVEAARCAGVHAGTTRSGLRGGERLLVWESAHPAVVLPRNGAADAWANLEACAVRDIPILRRNSGGGAVVLGPGCLNFALILSLDARPELADVAGSYVRLLGALADALAIPDVTIRSTDLALGNRKFAGHAQRRLRRTLLHHGAILYRFDLGLIDALLPEPPRRPAWRGSRRHREFLTNVPFARADLVARLRQVPAALAARGGSPHIHMTERTLSSRRGEVIDDEVGMKSAQERLRTSHRSRNRRNTARKRAAGRP